MGVCWTIRRPSPGVLNSSILLPTGEDGSADAPVKAWKVSSMETEGSSKILFLHSATTASTAVTSPPWPFNMAGALSGLFTWEQRDQSISEIQKRFRQMELHKPVLSRHEA
ncbi:hypothetical protein MUK42_34292 [Musa troglodytarum]|uniref:Uncharacterized protein n=1 Tax=Musa troglodytarum TaxID=320322 RepID=A0A9E7FPA1_9LILI|nr:hypothetical protein MUK42_34292 [Musa troglodytarum]